MIRLAGLAVIVSILLLISMTGYAVPAAEALCFGPYGANNVEATAEGENLYVLWEYGTDGSTQPGNHYLQFTRSTDGGKSFTEIINLHQSDPKCSIFPRIAADGDNVYVMWADGSILFRASNDNGATFDETISLGEGHLGSIGTAWDYNDGGHVLADGNRVYAVWNNNGDIIFRKSSDAGRTFDPAMQLSRAAESYRPEIALSGDDIYVIWTQNVYRSPSSGNMEDSRVLFARSTDNGETFTEPIVIEESTGDILFQPYPLIVASETHVYVLWKQDGLNYVISTSKDGGATFSDKVMLSDLENEQSYATLFTAFDDTVYVAWKTGEGRPTIVKSTDGGKAFSEADLRIPQEFSAHPGQMVMKEDRRADFMWLVFSEEERRISFASVQEGAKSIDPIHVLEKPYVANTEPPFEH